MEMGYADWVVAKYLANYSIRWIAEQTGTAQAIGQRGSISKRSKPIMHISSDKRISENF